MTVERDVRVAVAAGVAAAAAGAADAFAPAVERLSTVDPPKVAVLLGWIVRALLERTHPDGMDGADLRAVLTGATAAAGGWDSGVDPTALLVVLTGALGVSDPEQQAVTPVAVARNALLLIAHLLGGRDAGPWLDAAFAELRRAETVELP